MSAFDYLSVLISIVLALGMTRVLAGIGEMLQASLNRRIFLSVQTVVIGIAIFHTLVQKCASSI